MISVSLLFMFAAGVAFLGYLLTALFYKIKIAASMPLMLIGLLIGPVLHVVNTTSSGIVVRLAPYFTALAVAFILFDVGIKIRIKDLSLVYASRFTFSLAIATGVVLGMAIWASLHLPVLLSFAAGFGLAGPSAVVIPTILKTINVNPKLKASLNFESVVVDSVTLIIPILLIEFLAIGKISLHSALSLLASFFIGSFLIGIISAFFWVFFLRYFKRHIGEYSWMLTITMVIATYGIAQALGANGGVAVFSFGLMLANMSSLGKSMQDYTKPISHMLMHISQYQKEIAFFISTFLFVYIGILFTFSPSDYYALIASIGICVIIFYLRKLFLPLLEKAVYPEKLARGSGNYIAAQYSVARGMSPIVVATLPASFGVYAPSSFISVLFLSILFTNLVTTYGMYLLAKGSRHD